MHSHQSIRKHNLKGFSDIFAKHDSKTSLEFCIICGPQMTIIANGGMLNVQLLLQGSYRQVCVKSKDFSELLKDFPPVFKDCKLMKNTDLHVKILFLKC